MMATSKPFTPRSGELLRHLLRRRREELGLRQNQAPISRHYWALENKNQVAKPETLKLLADWLQIPYEHIEAACKETEKIRDGQPMPAAEQNGHKPVTTLALQEEIKYLTQRLDKVAKEVRGDFNHITNDDIRWLEVYAKAHNRSPTSYLREIVAFYEGAFVNDYKRLKNLEMGK